MLNKKFVFAVSLVAMMAVSNAWATDPASTPSTSDTVGTAHSVFTAYTPTEAGSKAGIAGVTYVNRAVNSAGNAAIAAENHAAASGAYAIDAKSAAQQANTAAAAAKAAADAAQATASEGVTKANAAQQTANTANATANKNKTDIADIKTEQGTQNTNISNLQTAVAGKQGTLKAGTNISISADNTISSTYTYTLPTATDDVKGGMKLYTASGAATDGTMTQKAITDLVDSETTDVLEEAQGIVDNLENRVSANETNISNLQTTVAGKQGTLSEAQLAAVNSGITKTKVETYDGYSALITNAQNTANSKLATATYNTQVGTVSATNMGTEATTVVGGIKEAVTEAAAAQSTANKNTAAISGMDLTSVGADGSYIKTVAQADGKVTATAEAADTTPTQNSKKMVTSGGVYTALSNKLDKTGTAPKATADASGNVITSTYATKSELTSGLATKQNNLGYTAENSANKVTALSADSTDTQYPSAKLVYTELAKKQNNLTIDTAMSSTSTNPVQNKVVNTALGTKENVSNKVTALSADSTDAQYPSAKLVYTELAKKQNNLTIDTAMSSTSTNPVQNKVVYTALSNKLDKTGTAPKATADASGNVITSTYATKSELTSGLATKQNNLGYTAENSANKVTALSADSTDTQYPSAKLVYTELAKKQNNLTIDSAMSSTSTNPVQNKVVNAALSNKLDKTGTAPKATADASGNVITSTYATKSELTSGLATKQGTLKAGTNISISGDNTISSTYTYTLPTATDDVKGGMKLYTASGEATDGTMTQKAITDFVDSETNDVLEEAQGIVDNLETRVSANETDISNLQTTVAGKQGTLKAGTNISISADNTISSTYTYTLPTATASVKGGVTIGSNIGVNSGKISVADATATTKGVSVLGVIPSGGTGSAATGTATIWVE